MDETRQVPTRFEVQGYERTMTQVGALGSAFSGLGGLISRTTSMLNPLNLAVGALGGALSGHAIMKAGSEFEDLQIGLAQTLRFMGEGGKTFEDAMHNSSVMMKRIVADAGPLPGNAMDYANALQVAGTTVNRATGDFQKTYDLVRKTTAVSISMGGSAALGAVELNRMLDATKGMLHSFGDFNQKILVSMRQLPGMANLTTHEFNKFELHKRLDLVTRAMGQFDDQVKAASSTWTAVKGAIESTSSLLVKSSTAPLFDAAKKNLFAMNNAILQADGDFTPLGQRIVNIGNIISNKLVAGFDLAVHAASRLGGALDRMADSPLFKQLAGIAPALAGITLGSMGARGGPAAAAVMGFAGQKAGDAGSFKSGLGGEIGEFARQMAQVSVLFSPMSIGLTGFMDAISRAGVATSIFEGAMRMFELVRGPLEAFAEVSGRVSGMVGDLFEGALPGLISMLTSIMEPIGLLWEGLSGVAGELLGAVAPALKDLWQATGALFSSVGDFLNPILRVLGAIVVGVAGVLSDLLGPAVNVVAGALSGLAHGISALLSWLGNLMGKAFDNLGIALPHKDKTQQSSNALMDFFGKLKNFGKGGAPPAMAMIGGKGGAGGAMRPPEARGGGGRVVQDFRFSRFEIEQKFAEGFDPDRIAVVFAKDIGRLGEKKLQSGLEPAFGVR